MPATRTRLRLVRGALSRVLMFLLLGVAANVVVAYTLGLFMDVSAGRTETAGTWTGQNQWTVTRWSRRGATFVLSVREPGVDWSPGQATGPPDTPTGGDQITAWASQTPDGQAEWLQLDYAEAVEPKAVRVYEIYSTGAVNKVTVFDPDGDEVEAWAGTDPTPRGSRIATSEIPLRPMGFRTRRVKIYLDSPNVPNWNEIDAVALVAADDTQQWAVGAEASSTYASSRGGLSLAGGGAMALAPEWGGLRRATEDLARFRIRREERAIDARGWPMLSLWGRIPSSRVTQQATGAPLNVVTGNGTMSRALSGGPILTERGGTPTAPVAGEPPLLIHPIWRGFLINSVFYAVVLLGLFWALTVPRRFVREVGRMRRGCCVACGYDLGFNFMPGCPECGWRRGSTAGDK